MKKTISTFLICITCLTISAQNTFFKWYSTDSCEYINNAIELKDNSFIISGSQSENNNSITNSYMLRIDDSGNKIAEQFTTLSDTNTCNTILFFLPGQTDTINSVNHIRTENTNGTFEFISFERHSVSNLNLIDYKKFAIPINKSFCPQYFLIEDSNLIILSHYADYLPNYHPLGTYITKYNFSFDSITSYFDERFVNFEIGLIKDNENNIIKSISGSYGNIYISNLDSNINLVNNIHLTSSFITAVCATPLSESKYVIAGTTNELPYSGRQIKVITNNMSEGKIDSTLYYNDTDSILYAGFVSNTALVGHNIFVVGNYLINPSQYPFQNTPTYIQISRMDTNLNILDHHFYGGDAVYASFKILSTSDGGALITGLRYDHTNPSVQRCHPFALKVNTEGVCTELNDGINSISHSAIVFPNPGKDILNLTSGIQLNQGVFTLFDMQGRPVIEKEINATEMQFEVSALSSGSYVWQIVLNNKVMDSGKWVKE